jgi:hypothetical protein
MILYRLTCSDGHQFEAWFRDGATYDAQSASGDVECPFCGSAHVTKAPMAPHLATAGKKTAEVRAREVAEQILQAVNKLHRHVEENCDYVGDEFAEEARAIHNGDTEERDIYGEATDEEATDLDEEGIEFYRLPQRPRRDS